MADILHQHPEDRYVAAALSLFASVALLFWYVLQLFSPETEMRLRRWSVIASREVRVTKKSEL